MYDDRNSLEEIMNSGKTWFHILLHRTVLKKEFFFKSNFGK